MKNTISGFQAHFSDLYGLRNHFVNNSFSERAVHMFVRIGKIYDAKRKEEKMPGRLARAVSYFMSCVNSYDGLLDLELGMMEKFPSFGCRYCTHMPCDCGPGRPNPTSYEVDMSQRDWTVSRWQSHMQQVYGHNNIDNFDKAFGRLMSEFGELCLLNAHGPHTPIEPHRIIEECRREAADVFSWLLTLAYVLHYDLEQEVIQRYTSCPGCKKKRECNCHLVFISKDGQEFSTVGTHEFGPSS